MTKSVGFRKLTLFSFAVCFLYWVYLLFTCHMVISCDAIGYEQLGKLLCEKGWVEYFKTGPNREPFYPFLVSLAMRIGDYFSIPYQPVMIVFQFLILLLTQLIALYIILRILKINNLIASLTILYLGISPGIVSSALSLFSEIATYPIILAIALINYYAWISFDKSKIRIMILAVISGMLFCFMTLNKGIFEVITPVFLVSGFIFALFTRRKKIILSALIYLLVTSAVFYLPITSYKLANKKFNDHFAVTNRGDYRLYGAAACRVEPLTTEQLLVALAGIPGEGFCQRIFGEEKCSYWSFIRVDEPGATKLNELINKGLRPEEASSLTVRLAIKKAMQNPAQYILLWTIEGSKMLFWESTKMGFVSYPEILNKIFNMSLLKNGLRFSMAILTFLALLYTALFLWGRRKSIFEAKSIGHKNAEIFLLFCLLLISLFIGAYSLFATVPRFALPIAPLYLILIAFFLQKVISMRKR